MQIRILKISNIGSFPYVDNLNTIKGIHFQTGEKGQNNILIGPNGSGKSTMLHIIDQFFTIGLQDEVIRDNKDGKNLSKQIMENKYHHSGEADKNTDDKKNIFQPISTSSETAPHKSKLIIRPNTFTHLEKNDNFPDRKSSLYVELLLNQEDLNNLLFVQKYRTTLEHIINKYTDKTIHFTSVDKNILVLQNIFKIYASLDFAHKNIVCKKQRSTPVRMFLFEYFRYYQLIQTAIALYNTYEKAPKEKSRYPLRNTFAFLPSHRDNLRGGQGYRLCQQKIARLGHDSEFFARLDNIVYKYTTFHLSITPDHDLVYERHNHRFTFDELASGEQAFILLILTVFGFDMQNGLLIIDEPELHLHPQSQQHFLNALKEMTELFELQSIIATHSPVMVDIFNIDNVLRASTTPQGTYIHTKTHKLSQDEGTLLHMLKYDNIAKMFFVNTIIMVEGETDLIFRSHYLDYLQTTDQWKHRIHHYEIINIGGKTIFKQWKKLLGKFGIRTFYVGDRDNILDMGIPNNVGKRKKYLHHNKSNIPPKYHITHKTQIYEKLILFLHDRQHQQRQRLYDKIIQLHDEHIFLLQRGDLETYLQMPKKGLTETVDWCQQSFTNWLEDERYHGYRTELEALVGMIFPEQK